MQNAAATKANDSLIFIRTSFVKPLDKLSVIKPFDARSFQFKPFAIIFDIENPHALARRLVRLVECQLEIPGKIAEKHAVSAVAPEKNGIGAPRP
jgi:hypothetical protein